MIQIGPSRHSKGGTLRFGYYEPSPGDTAHRIALWVTSREGEREYVATCNIPEITPASGFVHLKDWSENEGVPNALYDAGVVRMVGTQTDGTRPIVLAELTRVAMEELEAQSPARPPLGVQP